MNSMYWSHYSKNREIQHGGGLELLSFWENEWKEDDIVLDLGCGTGELTRMIAAKENVKAVKGVDVSVEAINIARQNNSLPSKVQYIVSDATKLTETCSEFGNYFTKVFSNAVLHWIEDKEKTLRTVQWSLKPKGSFVCLFTMGGNQITRTIVSDHCKNHPKWKQYLQNFRDNTYPFSGTLDDANDTMKRCGFKLDKSYVTIHRVQFDTREKHKAFIKPLLGQLDYIPTDLHEEFLEYAYQTFVSIAPRDDKGNPY
ncbi:juvenile hormone acid O-methyltransferase-like [Glandiceps talaboti]